MDSRKSFEKQRSRETKKRAKKEISKKGWELLKKKTQHSKKWLKISESRSTKRRNYESVKTKRLQTPNSKVLLRASSKRPLK